MDTARSIPTPSTSIGPKIGQTWNTEDYALNGRFVATLATDVVALLAPHSGEQILDLGCGDGALTEQLAATGAILTGVDASPTMLAAARQRNLHVEQHDATALPYRDQFDAIFSNAVLHWIPGTLRPPGSSRRCSSRTPSRWPLRRRDGRSRQHRRNSRRAPSRLRAFPHRRGSHCCKLLPLAQPLPSSP